MRTTALRLLVATCVLLAGCSSVIDVPDSNVGDDALPDPPSDRLGWEAGYWHNESIDVDQSDGLSDAELDAFVGRAMARVEHIRGKEFLREVPVDVVAREEYRTQTNRSGRDDDFAAWNNQVWEATFVTGEDADVQRELGAARGAAVIGFYSIGADEIKIVTETPERPVIRNGTLIHELVHALQDQHLDLGDPRYQGATQDESLAIDGIVEGEANFVEQQYHRRCGTEWECVATPDQRVDGSDTQSASLPRPNLGILLTTFQPYSDGPVYVSDLYDRGGWGAVDEAMRDPPVSTEQVIHRTDEAPTPIRFTDRARSGWSTFPDQGVEGSDTVGEASIFVMFWLQAREYGADTVETTSLLGTDDDLDTYNYRSAPSAGWDNDRLVPYRAGSSESPRYGYVWVTQWDTPTDAREFHQSYLAVLAAHDATRRADGIYVVRDGPFADAFRVERRGNRVVIVNGPTPRAVEHIRPRPDSSA